MPLISLIGRVYTILRLTDLEQEKANTARAKVLMVRNLFAAKTTTATCSNTRETQLRWSEPSRSVLCEACLRLILSSDRSQGIWQVLHPCLVGTCLTYIMFNMRQDEANTARNKDKQETAKLEVVAV